MFYNKTKKSQSDCPTIDPVKDAIDAATTIVKLSNDVGRLERYIKSLSNRDTVEVSWGEWAYERLRLPADVITAELERQLAETKTKLLNLARNF